MRQQTRSMALLVVLVLAAVLVPSAIAYTIGLQLGRDLRMGMLEQRVEQLEQQVAELKGE
jgi:hypothetical protein